MKKLILFIILVLVQNKSFGQKSPQFTELLNKGSVTAVNNYMLKNDEILKHEYAENNIYWRLYREVLP